MTYNVFSGTLSPTQSISRCTCVAMTVSMPCGVVSVSVSMQCVSVSVCRCRSESSARDEDVHVPGNDDDCQPGEQREALRARTTFCRVIHDLMHIILLIAMFHFLSTQLQNHLCCVKNMTVFFGSRPSDHYFRSVCLSVSLFVCLFLQSFCQPFLIRFLSNLGICYMSGSSCVP